MIAVGVEVEVEVARLVTEGGVGVEVSFPMVFAVLSPLLHPSAKCSFTIIVHFPLQVSGVLIFPLHTPYNTSQVFHTFFCVSVVAVCSLHQIELL